MGSVTDYNFSNGRYIYDIYCFHFNYLVYIWRCVCSLQFVLVKSRWDSPLSESFLFRKYTTVIWHIFWGFIWARCMFTGCVSDQLHLIKATFIFHSFPRRIRHPCLQWALRLQLWFPGQMLLPEQLHEIKGHTRWWLQDGRLCKAVAFGSAGDGRRSVAQSADTAVSLRKDAGRSCWVSTEFPLMLTHYLWIPLPNCAVQCPQTKKRDTTEWMSSYK